MAIEIRGATASRSVTTDASGFYRATALPAGTYIVVFSRAGFQTKVLEGVTLRLDETVSLRVVMGVAPRSETVTVRATVPLLNRTNFSIRQAIELRAIESIPLNGRNYLDLIQLAPGVVVNSTARSDLTDRDTRGSILGERAGNAAFLIDGVDNNDDFHGGVFQAFTQDAVQEFEVIEAGYKAEFGNGSGGIINVITRSGSNALHGGAFFYLRNDALDSSNVAGQGPPELSRYDLGGTFGGPLQKDRSWFFGSAERVQEGRAAIFPPNIPSVLEASEDFTRQPQTSDLRVFGRYDQRIRQRHDLRATLSWTRARLENQLASAVALPSASNNSLARTWLGKVSLTSAFSAHTVLDAAVAVRAQDFGQNQGAAAGLAGSVFFLDDGTSFWFNSYSSSAAERAELPEGIANKLLKQLKKGKE